MDRIGFGDLGLVLLAVGFVLVGARPAAAQDVLVRAERQLQSGQFRRCLVSARKALEDPDSGPLELVEAYRLRGFCLVGQGRVRKAIEAFKRLLAIDKSYEPPPGSSPKLTTWFYETRSQNRATPQITLGHRSPDLGAGVKLAGQAIGVRIKSDPYKMVARIRIRCRFDGRADWTAEDAPDDRGRISFTLPGGIRATLVRYYFEALNAHGGVVARLGGRQRQYKIDTEDLVLSPDLVEIMQDDPEVQAGAGRSGALMPTLGHAAFWSGLGLAALGGVATWRAVDEGDRYQATNGEDEAAGRRSQAWAGVMYTGFGLGAALMATGVTLWLLEPSGPPRPGVSVGPLPGGGFGFGLAGGF